MFMKRMSAIFVSCFLVGLLFASMSYAQEHEGWAYCIVNQTQADSHSTYPVFFSLTSVDGLWNGERWVRASSGATEKQLASALTAMSLGKQVRVYIHTDYQGNIAIKHFRVTSRQIP